MDIQNEDLVIEKNKNEHGSISKAMKLIAKRQGALDAFMLYRNQILDNGPLSKKERALILLASTVALKSASCITIQSKNAKQAGVSEDEVIQTILIAGLVSGNSPLSVAYSSCYNKEN